MFRITLAIHIPNKGNVVFEEVRVSHFKQHFLGDIVIPRIGSVGQVECCGGKAIGWLERVGRIDVQKLQPFESEQPASAKPHVPWGIPVNANDRDVFSQAALEFPEVEGATDALIEIYDTEVNSRQRRFVGHPLVPDELAAQLLKPFG